MNPRVRKHSSCLGMSKFVLLGLGLITKIRTYEQSKLCTSNNNKIFIDNTLCSVLAEPFVVELMIILNCILTHFV